jgi:hypothetical protein
MKPLKHNHPLRMGDLAKYKVPPRTYLLRPKKISCPRCKAEPGQSCVSDFTGRVLTDVHLDRKRLAASQRNDLLLAERTERERIEEQEANESDSRDCD